MKAILIDPHKKVISEVSYNGDWRQISHHIKCDTFTVVSLPDNNDIYIDDFGLFAEKQAYFRHIDYPEPLAGYGLILGHDPATGDSVETNLTALDVSKSVQFFDPEHALLTAGHVSKEDLLNPDAVAWVKPRVVRITI